MERKFGGNCKWVGVSDNRRFEGQGSTWRPFLAVVAGKRLGCAHPGSVVCSEVGSGLRLPRTVSELWSSELVENRAYVAEP